MSEKSKFYNMTRPPKFRGIKMCLQFLKDWWQGVSSVIYNRYLSILYKYKLFNIKRYSYRDKREEVFPAPLYFRRGVQTQNFKAIVEMKLVERWDIDIDYFYKKQKDGTKKILLVFSDREDKRLFAVSNLKEIAVSVDGKDFYELRDRQSTFVVNTFNDSLFKPTEFTDKVESINISTQRFDMTPIYNLRHESIIDTKRTHEEINPEELVYYYNFAVDCFKRHLARMKLEDLA